MSPRARRLLTWLVGPLAVAALAGGLSHRAGVARLGPTFAAVAARSPAERAALASAPALAVANAIWALGSADAVREMARVELDRLPESENLRRSRVFMRFGIVDTSPDGQAALFGQACVADPRTCDHQKEAAERETRVRFVAPGNTLPLYFLGGHPHAFAP